ncbi:hypothetical protein HYE66_06540 [Aggregatibacter actinomycetemcomitans]|nr:hypothetical protein [Aggregatibacter actinomycetemcomitans]
MNINPKKHIKAIGIFLLGAIATKSFDVAWQYIFPDNSIEERSDAILIQSEIAKIRTKLNSLENKAKENKLSREELDSIYDSLYLSYETIRDPLLRYPFKNNVLVTSNNRDVLNNGKRISGKDYSIISLGSIINGINLINNRKDILIQKCEKIDFSLMGNKIVDDLMPCNGKNLIIDEIKIYIGLTIDHIQLELDNDINGFKKDGKERKIHIEDATIPKENNK